MKVLLIQPPSSSTLMDQAFLFEPLALEYLGAGLRLDRHEVRLLDARIEPDIEKACGDFCPDLVGLTGFTSHLNIIKDIVRHLKERTPAPLVVVGGHHATVCPRDFNEPYIDAVVIGEGVFALREIVQAGGNGGGFRHIRGLAVPGPGEMMFTEPRPYTDLNALPFPNRSLTARYRTRYFSEWFKPLASIRTSLGCTARCTFCALWSITGGKYLRRTPESVVEELRNIEEKNVFFCDDESMCDAKRMDRLADLIRTAGIKKRYFLYGRVDTIVNHPELFAKWAEIGLAQVFVGMEDYSEERLRAMKKGVTPEQQKQAVRILDDLGIMMYASYMIDPSYTRDDFHGMLAYVRQLKHQYATFTVMTPLPGTELYRERKRDLLSRKPELFDMLHALTPTTLPLPEFYRELAHLYLKAVPFLTGMRTLAHFGPRGIIMRIKVLGKFLQKVRAAHLDY